jgi:hypothetical protein
MPANHIALMKRRRLQADDDNWRKQVHPLSQEEKLRAREESPYTKIECMRIKVEKGRR